MSIKRIIGFVILALLVLGVLSIPIFLEGWKTGLLIDLVVVVLSGVAVLGAFLAASN